MLLDRVKNYVLSELGQSTVTIEAVFDAINLLHVMKFFGDFDSVLIGNIRKAVEGKQPDLLPIVLERMRDLQVRSVGDEDFLSEYEDIGKRFKRAGDTHGFVHNGLWRCAVIHAKRGNFDDADKHLDHADNVLERGVSTNALFVRPSMDTYQDKIANCRRLRAMVEAGKEVYKGTRNFRPAQNVLLEALRIHRDIGQVHGVANDLRDLAKVSMLKGDFDSAAVCINRAQHKYKTVRDLYMAEECSNILKLNSSNSLPVNE